MSRSKKLLYILGFFFAMLPFQNCGKQFQQGSFFSANEKASDSGNGGGYEGKPDGTYYRFSPSYTCEGKPAAEEITEIKNGQAYLYTNKDNQCGSQGTAIPLGEINTSPFQSEFISVKDSLFKRYDEKPAGIPNTIAEVSCRDDFEHPTFEIVSHYDREKNEAYTRVYQLDQQISDFPVSRILSSGQVRYVANNISFNVDLSKAAYPERKFAGVLETTTIAGLQPHPLVCVIGGSLDTSKWKLKALTNIDASGFRLLKNNEMFFFSEISRDYVLPNLYIAVKHLFKIGTDNVVSDFSKAEFGADYDITYGEGSVDDILYLFSGKKVSETWTSKLFYDSRTGKVKRLTNLMPGADPEQYSFKHPVLTADQHLFYDTQILAKDMSRSLVVRVYDFSDDSIRDVATLEAGRDDYTVLPKSNQLVVFRKTNETSSILEVYDAKTKSAKTLPLILASNCQRISFTSGVPSVKDTILADQFCDDGGRNVVKLSLNEGTVNVLGANSSITWASKDGYRIIMTDASAKSVAYDSRTGTIAAIPVIPHFGENGLSSGLTDFELLYQSSKIALTEDRWLYGFGGTLEAGKMYQVDLQSGVSAEICKEALGTKLFVGALPNNKVFLFTYDAAIKVYRFYQAKSPTECARINEFPSEYPNVPRLVTTNIGFALSLGRPITRDANETSVEAVFVPVDGRPPMKFNPGTTGNWQIDVSVDKNKVFLHGPDVDNVMKIFSFDLN